MRVCVVVAVWCALALPAQAGKRKEEISAASGGAGPVPVPTTPAPPVQHTLVFTEYVEGSRRNKAVEISNTGTQPVHFGQTDYRVYIAGRARGIALQGTLQPGAALVLVHPRSSMEMKRFARARAGLFQESRRLRFNGDDTVALVDDASGTVMDRIGAPQMRQPWLRDLTIRREAQEASPQPEGFTSIPAGWVTFPKDTFDGLGCTGRFTCGTDTLAPTDAPATPTATPASQSPTNQACSVQSFGFDSERELPSTAGPAVRISRAVRVSGAGSLVLTGPGVPLVLEVAQTQPRAVSVHGKALSGQAQLSLTFYAPGGSNVNVGVAVPASAFQHLVIPFDWQQRRFFIQVDGRAAGSGSLPRGFDTIRRVEVSASGNVPVWVDELQLLCEKTETKTAVPATSAPERTGAPPTAPLTPVPVSVPVSPAPTVSQSPTNEACSVQSFGFDSERELPSTAGRGAHIDKIFRVSGAAALALTAPGVPLVLEVAQTQPRAVSVHARALLGEAQLSLTFYAPGGSNVNVGVAVPASAFEHLVIPFDWQQRRFFIQVDGRAAGSGSLPRGFDTISRVEVSASGNVPVWVDELQLLCEKTETKTAVPATSAPERTGQPPTAPLTPAPVSVPVSPAPPVSQSPTNQACSVQSFGFDSERELPSTAGPAVRISRAVRVSGAGSLELTGPGVPLVLEVAQTQPRAVSVHGKALSGQAQLSLTFYAPGGSNVNVGVAVPASAFQHIVVPFDWQQRRFFIQVDGRAAGSVSLPRGFDTISRVEVSPRRTVPVWVDELQLLC